MKFFFSAHEKIARHYQAGALFGSVFLCGATLMMFELVGSRMFAPYLGTSTFVWTSLIGVILGFLSLGYWYGGKIADQKTSFEQYACIIFAAAISVLFVFCVHTSVLSFFQQTIQSLELSATLSAIILFAPTGFLLGIVSPYAVRLKMVHMEHSASTVGNLYAVSTAGSIFGTFFAGFVLIPTLGTAENILLFALILLFTSLLFLRTKSMHIAVLGVFIFICSLYALRVETRAFLFTRYHILDIDSKYSRIKVYPSTDRLTGKEVLNVSTDPFGTECAMFVESDELVFAYTKFYRLDGHFKPDLKNTLMLGGCAYSYPKDFLKRFPNAHMDVVEIDPVMTELAKKYFRLKDDDRLTTYHEDARRFLNRSDKKYDVIYGDAFNSFSSVPFQLTTKEAIQLEYDALNDGGVVLANLISSIDDTSGKFLRAQFAMYRSVFTQVYLFPVTYPEDGAYVQNILLVAIKSDKPPLFESEDPELNEYLKHRWLKEVKNDLPILTDDYAPVDYYKRESL